MKIGMVPDSLSHLSFGDMLGTAAELGIAAIGAELEVVPDRVAAEISKRTPLIMLSMGGGGGW